MMQRNALLFLLVSLLPSVNGQRVKEGCFDRYQMTCDSPWSLEGGVDPEAVCTKLALETLPTQDVILDVTTHPEFLNSIEASTQECQQVNQVYSMCSFCLPGEELGACYEQAVWTECGGRMTLEEIIQTPDNELDSLEDVDQFCEDYIASRANILFKDEEQSFPPTIRMCNQVRQAKHLCPGFCEGGCFDGPTGVPPSCDKQRYSGPFSDNLKPWEVCNYMDYDILWWMGPDQIFNISNHADYLKAIPGNSTECQDAQQSYNQCYWCATGQCFDDEAPPTCDKSRFDPSLTFDETLELSELCRVMFGPLSSVFGQESPDLYNISLHQGALPFGSETEFCDLAQDTYHECFWCHQEEYDDLFCSRGDYCASNATIPDDFVLIDDEQDLNVTNNLKTCQEIYDVWNGTRYNSFALYGCYRDLYFHRECPQVFCAAEAEEFQVDSYLGANTQAQKRALIWASRVSALLSFFGALFIIVEFFTRTNRRSSVYYELLCAMAIFDIITAVAWAFATAPIDESVGGYVVGAMGNAATCKTQAFFVQFGFTSIFYNVSLSVYYLLVIGYNWKEFQLQKLRWVLHVTPIVVGLGLALGAIPQYHFVEYGCHLLPPPDGAMWPVLVFVVIPLGISILSITGSMVQMYYAVRNQAHRSSRWLNGKNSRLNTLQREVFWQCLFYTLAFYITWPIMFSVYLASVDVHGPLALTLTVAFVAPLQGFNNFLIFIRPRLKQHFKKIRGHISSIVRPSSVESSASRYSTNHPTTAVSTSSRVAFDSSAEKPERPPEPEIDPTMDPSAILPLMTSSRQKKVKKSRRPEQPVAEPAGEAMDEICVEPPLETSGEMGEVKDGRYMYL